MHPPEGSVSAVFWCGAESVVCGAVATGDVRDLGTAGVMTGQERHADVVILAALREEYEAVLQVDAGAVPNSAWERTTSADGLPLAFRSFEVSAGRPPRVAAGSRRTWGRLQRSTLSSRSWNY